MDLFQVLSTKIEPDGWMDINIMTPCGVVSIECHLNEKSVRSFHVSDCLCVGKNNQPEEACCPEGNLVDSLLTVAESLADQNNTGGDEPFKPGRRICFNKNLSKQ
ncbi:MAG: hypothetical protein DSY90_00870 [Deltaproteobacteria bacterium]|nr:MAG: hypothetical protein DSY90_00870 [Deltaproteobacteria bacterium]